jgi:hypothetical protein
MKLWLVYDGIDGYSVGIFDSECKAKQCSEMLHETSPYYSWTYEEFTLNEPQYKIAGYEKEYEKWQKNN